MNQKFSVLMSVYSKELPELLDVSLDSIFNQSTLPNEVVVIVDGPIPIELISVLESYLYMHPTILRIFKLDENVGLAKALNFGLSKCRYSLVARMDSDDVCEFKRFETQLAMFKEKPHLDVIGSYVNEIDINSEFIKVRKVPQDDEKIRKMIWSCPMVHPSIMYKKDRILEIGGYNSTLKRRQDYELWYRAQYYNLRFQNIDIPLLNYRTNIESYRIKNSFTVQLNQLKIGIRGNYMNKLPLISYLGVLSNFVYNILPYKLRNRLSNLKNQLDPRERI